jgi:tetratricopeptide (TPR) repeat protein
MWLSGAVVMEDGSKPPDTVTIELVSCNGTARPQAYTDSKGHFSFQVGQNSYLIPDASVGGARQRPGSAPTPGGGMGPCELRASLPGYRSDVVNLVHRGRLDNPEVGTIVLHRLSGVEGTTISMTSLQAPRDAKALFDKGLKSEDKGKWAEGEKHFERAVSIYPQYAAAWNEIGLCLENQQKLPEAREAYRKALAADGKFVKPYLQLAGIALKERKWQEALDASGQVIKLNPVDFADPYFYSAVASFNLRDLDTAHKQAVEASNRDSQHRFPKIEHLLGIIRAQKGDLAAAAEHLKTYLQLSPKASDAGEARSELEQVEKLAASRAQAGSPR